MDAEEGERLLVAEYSRMAAVYDRDYAPYHAPMVARILELAGTSDTARILELGCGTGVLAFEAARRIGTSGFVMGIDRAEGMVHVAVAKRPTGAEKVRLARMDNRKLAFVEEAFDLVLSCFGIAALGHERAFREAHRVLRRGGRFVLCHWSGGSQGPAVAALLARFRPKDQPEELRRLLEARRSIDATGEPAAFGDPKAVLEKLRGIGFRDATHVKGSERVVYPDATAYLARGLAMGDNEREFRLMRPAVREAFLKEFEREAAPFTAPEGLVVRVGVNYFVARK